MSRTLQQIFTDNPITTNQGADLMYFARSPYTPGNDAGMLFSDFSAQFGTPFTPSALTKTDDTNVTLTLGGTPATALLEAVSITLGWTGVLSPARGGTGVNNGTNTLTLAGNLTTVGAFPAVFNFTASTNVTFPTSGTLATTGQLPTPAALTKTDDTNVTVTLGGTPATALLQPVSLTLGWTGQLSETRGGTAQSSYVLGDTLYSSAANTLSKLSGNITTTKQYLSQTGTGAVSAAPVWATIAGSDISGAALTKTDDTNVTLTLGGTPTTALLRTTSLTLGWTGQLSLARGGSNASLTASNGGIVYSTSSAMAILAGTSTANQMLQSGANTTPAWSSTTWPSTSTINQILFSSAANVISGITSGNNGILVTSAGGVPSIGNTVGAGLIMPSINFNSTTGIIGTTTNDSAAAGSVGEHVESVIALASAISLSSLVVSNVTSISLTSGDWDVWGNVGFTGNAATTFLVGFGWISETSATLPDASLYSSFITNSSTTLFAVSPLCFCVPYKRISVPSSTTRTVYLSVDAFFSVNSCSAFGGIYSRRVR